MLVSPLNTSFKMLLVVLLSLIAVSLAYDCGNPAIKPDTQRIIGGKEARPHSWPWNVAFFKQMFGTWTHFCGGSLIDPQWIMSAGHCFYGQNDPSAFKVLLGAHYDDRTEPTQLIVNISEIHVNPEFNPKNASGDITLLKLERKVIFNDYISPVCLPNKTSSVPDNTTGYVTGWGNIENGTQSKMLMQVDLPVVNQDKCKEEYLHVESLQIDKTMICGGFDKGGKGACNGDSGGPWVFSQNGTWTQYGIVSWGYHGCAIPHFADVFARVTELRDFINSTIGH